MADGTGDGSRVRWIAAECPFLIECDATAMDDIRLAVTDAFFSLPRGGAEIGGILLGEYAPGKLTITGYQALDCEHAYGPGFTLSPNDHARMAELIASTPGRGKDVVGWYHSHTRSEIMLTEADLDVHNRYFNEAWQVAMVMKPSAFKPARCGFFFREKGGRIRSDASYNAFELTPQAVAPAPAPGPAERRRDRSQRDAREKTREPEPAHRLPGLTLDAVLKNVETAPPPAAAPAVAVPAEARQNAAPDSAPGQPESVADAQEPVPAFATATESRVSAWYWLAIAVLVGVLVYQTREYWIGSRSLSQQASGTAPAAAPAVPSPSSPQPATRLSLGVSDAAGQLQIRWDGTAQLVRDAASGTVELEDGEHKAVIPLDQERLRGGSITYSRESQSVGIRLTVEDARGNRVQEAASFFGKVPDRSAPGADAEAAKQRDQLQQEVNRLRTALTTQTERANRLEKNLDEVRRQLKRDQQRRRLENQIRDPLQ